MLHPQLPTEGNAQAGDRIQRLAYRRKDCHFPLTDEETYLTTSGFCMLSEELPGDCMYIYKHHMYAYIYTYTYIES